MDVLVDSPILFFSIQFAFGSLAIIGINLKGHKERALNLKIFTRRGKEIYIKIELSIYNATIKTAIIMGLFALWANKLISLAL